VIWRTRRRRDAAERARVERHVDAELEFHRACTVEELIAGGLGREEAEAEARRRFGPVTPYRQRLVRLDVEHAIAQRRRSWMHLIAISVRTVIRDARRSPGFTLGIVAILTLGLGVNAITFGLVDRLVLRGPTGLSSPGELRRVVVHRRSRSGASIATTELGYLDYRDLLQNAQLTGAAGESRTLLLFGSGGTAERIHGLLVTASYFPLLGVSPALGRFFTGDESEREGARVVVLGHAFWQRRFGGDPGALGQVLPIEGHRYTVVGVAPRHFTGTAVARTDVFLPLEAASDEQIAGPWRTSRRLQWMGAVIRLAPGTDAVTAAAEATSAYRNGYADVPGADPGARVELVPLNAIRGPTASGELGVAGLVGGVSLLVLLITTANATNLFLARSLRRRNSIALRIALGGGRWRLITEQTIEGAILALAGATAAVVVASLGAPGVQRLLFPQVAWLESVVDLRLLLVLGGCAVVGGGLAAALPMWQAGREDVTVWLKAGGQRGSRAGARGQAALVLVQGALSVLLLVGAGLFVRSMERAQSLNLGLDANRLLVVSVVRGDEPLAAGFRDQLRARIEKIPGVERTSRVAGTLPFVSSWAIHLSVPDLPERPRVDDGGPYIHAVEPGYFRTTGTRILRGRTFTDDDRPGSPRVAIVNQTMARLYWPGESALGKCLQIGPEPSPCSTIVGIAENTRRQEIVEGDSLLYYVPLEQAPDGLATGGRVIIRISDDGPTIADRVAERARREALALDPALRYVAVRSLDDLISPQLRAWRLGAGLFSAFGVLALVVASIGLYSVVAFTVEGRRREMGVRAALGATASSLLGLVVRDGLRASAGGVVLGLVLAWLLAPAISGLLYDVPAHDPAVYAGVTVVLVVSAVVASAIPGRRAGRVDPATALRDE